jgi:predicted dehydrogenase
MPYMAQLKKIIEEGTIGRLLSIDFNWYLDTTHGAQYFRRWHRHMNQSGGLLVHKSTHHFDLVNWWLDDQPAQVNAMGTRQYFGPAREQRGERCLTCDFKKSCEHYYDIQANKFIREHYYDNEKKDGYIRDKCVFGDDIDIYDTMSVQVQYQRGALLNYTLVAHSPYKNWTATFNGTEGRMEAGEYFRGPRAEEPMHQIQIYNRAGEVISRQTKKATGSHGGGDYRLQQMICMQSKDELRQRAGSMSGAMSLLIGVAANRSIVEGKCIRIQDLLD